MILHIGDQKTLADLQEKFSMCFPALCLQFYKVPHGRKETSLRNDQIPSTEKIGNIRNRHEAGNLQIFSYNTVADVEQAFRERFGLNVQIFRKENNWPVQTSSTDTLTLGEQSQMSAYTADHLFPLTSGQYNEYEEL